MARLDLHFVDELFCYQTLARSSTARSPAPGPLTTREEQSSAIPS